MPEMLEDIRNWLHQQPDWLQQATELILASNNVSDEDIQALVRHLKTEAGQQVTTTRAFDQLGPISISTDTLRLVEIGDISGIENLNPRCPLTFGEGNLSVIYGRNGSGKSGYTRLLKRMCGKPRARELKPNVFEPSPSTRECRIAYQLNGGQQEKKWLATDAPIDDLRAVDIFDTEAALFYLKEETEVAYTPPVVALFEALASVCDRVKERLAAEQRALVRTLPVLPESYTGTAAGKFFQGLSAGTSKEEVTRHTQWSEPEEQQLMSFTQRLATDDPTTQARKKRRHKEQVDKLVELLKSAATALGAPQLTQIREKRKTARTSRKAAAESAQILSTHLEGVGSDTWRAMWKAARAYSSLVAYPGMKYPVTEEGCRCVLCQQTLSDEARDRLTSFEKFVQGELEKGATAAEKVYRQALDALPLALTTEEITTRCQAAGLAEDHWAEQLGSFWKLVSTARKALLEDERSGAATPVVVPVELATALDQYSEKLEREVAQHEADATNFDRNQVAKDKLGLEAQRWVAQQAQAIHGEVGRLRQLDQYDTWLRKANSRPVSIKAGEIAERVITQAFVDRFNKELKALGALRIRVELVKTRTSRGKALHKIQLKGARTNVEGPDAVLSEGERRVVGLAAFLADMAGQSRTTPFVFDDPISSLDQDFEWHVAMRLAQLAQSRQVLVFTHRLSLYGAIEDATKKLGNDWKKHLVKHCIENYSGSAGHPVDQAAWNANTKTANNILLDRLTAAKKAGDEHGGEAYRHLAQGICGDFRKLLERTVEDDLLNEIVKRHRRSVTTNNRLTPLPGITVEDCRLIDDLMAKYSGYEHSQSEESPVFLPEEPELRADLEKLRDWRREFKKRPVELVE